MLCESNIAGARAALHAETGIPIVKDSSANKCGVICSSFEINSSMLLSHDEFLAIKPALVKVFWSFESRFCPSMRYECID